MVSTKYQELDAATAEDLLKVSTATASAILLKKGLRNCFVRGARPMFSPPRTVGRAVTLRFVSGREDLFTTQSLSSTHSVRAAVDTMPPGAICVADALGATHIGVMGDILCQRMRARGVAGLVTDGALRDAAGVSRTGLPIWCNGTAAPPSVNGLTYVGFQEPVNCGGVAVFPNDVILADEDGAIVIPSSLLDIVVELAGEQELLDDWVLRQVREGVSLLGLYPPDEERQRQYEAHRVKGGASST